MHERPVRATVARAPYAGVVRFAIVPHEREHRDLEAKIRKHEPRRFKRSVTIGQRDVHAGIAKPDDIRTPDATQVREKARMLVDSPPAGFEAEVGDHEPRLLERTIALAERDVDSRI